MEEVTLKIDKIPPGTRILFAHDSSSIHKLSLPFQFSSLQLKFVSFIRLDASAIDQQIKANATEIQFDLRNTSLVLPTETCGQMFLIAALWNHSSVNKKLLVAKRAWPFQVTCENGNI